MTAQPNPARDAEFFHFDPDEHEMYLPDGRRITAEVIDQYADLAERSGPPAGLIPGGKSLSGGSEHSPALRVVVSRDTSEAVKRRAADAHMSVSKWVRRLIEREIAA